MPLLSAISDLFRNRTATPHRHGHLDVVYSIAFSPSNQLVASGSFDKTIRFWDVESGQDIATLKGHSDKIMSVTFSPDGTMLASGSMDETIKLWDVGSRVRIATLKGHSSWVRSVAFSPDGAHLASGSDDKIIRLWDVKSRTIVSTLKAHSDTVNCVTFSPDGKIIASGSSDHTIRLWDTASGATIAVLGGQKSMGWVWSLAFSPSGEHIASGSGDRAIRLWDVTTGAQVSRMKGGRVGADTIAFSPNGKHLASGSFDEIIRLWDVPSSSLISTLKGHSGEVMCVAFSPDGARLASGSRDATVRIWGVSLEEETEPQDATFIPDERGLTQSTANSQQYTTALASVSIPPSNDITGSVSLEGITPIGSGGFGELFLGIHKEHGKVALKKPRRLLDEALVRRFLREVDLWCSVSHRYVLPCLGMCKVGLDVYVVSPFIKNGDLLSCMAKGKDLNRIKLLYEVAEALAHLHHRGIVHGDVKAQNALLGDDGSALLCDFGLAKAFDTMVTSTESKGAGSVRWMAPELCLGESRSMASDVYSLGITIAEILSGRTPFGDISENLAVMFHVAYHDGRPPKEPMNSPEGVSYATLWETAEKCWVKDIKTRPYMVQVLAMLFPLTREMQ